MIVARTRGQSERGPGEGSLAGASEEGPLSPTGLRPGSQPHLVKPPAPVTRGLGLPLPQLLLGAGPAVPLCGWLRSPFSFLTGFLFLVKAPSEQHVSVTT